MPGTVLVQAACRACTPTGRWVDPLPLTLQAPGYTCIWPCMVGAPAVMVHVWDSW